MVVASHAAQLLRLLHHLVLHVTHQAMVCAQSKNVVAARQLLALARLSNQAVGDAISGLLMVEAALTLLNWDLPSWADMYQELPSRQLKVGRCCASASSPAAAALTCPCFQVQVADRRAIKTTNAETRVAAPTGLQQAIDASMAQYPEGACRWLPFGSNRDAQCDILPPLRLAEHAGRAFVRPSGTEDVVRVYAEAATQAGADELAQACAEHVRRLA